MASNRITGRLRLRRFLRNPVTVAVFYALFIFSFSYIGSKTFWTHYYIWEVPSLAFGAASSLGILTLVSIFLGIILTSSYRKMKLSIWWSSFVRHGHVTRVLLVISVLLFSSALVLPERDSPIQQLIWKLSKKSSDLNIFLDEWEELNAYKKYRDNEGFQFLKRYYDFRVHRPRKRSEYEDWANYFSQFHSHNDPYIAIRAKMLTAECLDRLDKDDEAYEFYTDVVNNDIDDTYSKWWSYQEIGNYLYFQNKKDEAIEAWKNALTYIDSTGGNQNIAVVFEERKQFELAEEYYFKSQDALRENMRQNRNISLGESFSVLYTNWGNLYREWSKELVQTDANEAQKKIEQAKQYYSKAQRADPDYLDAYWSMVRLHIELEEYNLARWTIEKASFVLNNDEYYDLSRFNYKLISRKYAAYLSLVTDFYDPNQSRPTKHTLQMCRALIGWDYSREKSIEDFFQAAKQSGIALGEEVELINSQKFVSFISTS